MNTIKEVEVNTEAQASEMEKIALKEFEENIVVNSQRAFLGEGKLEAMVFIGMEKEGEFKLGIMPAEIFMRTVESKDLLSDLMKRLGKVLEPVCICMVSEVWMSVMDKGTTKEELQRRYEEMPPSKDPERQEKLMMTFESENIQRVVFYKISRDPLGLERDTLADNPNKLEGRFSNVLRDMKKIKHN